MMKNLVAVFLGVGLIVFPSAALAQFGGCQQDLSGKSTTRYICPPPMGDLVVDINGKFLCGPGQCTIDAHGKTRCSAKAGGRSLIDINGKVQCVGGCMDGRTDICSIPEYEPPR
ncbi:hypothetical protein LJB99_02655 [Deltaproteobacteria bacterium OttesenSCG-928-K17]|nr:hypothetical protein [Deltaproteobacteria bacterium OttesenSCG-928-K17]